MISALPMRFDGLIFDLDGTLWDASATCAKAWNETMLSFDQHAEPISEDVVRSFSGLPIATIFSRYFKFIPADRHDALIQSYHRSEKRLVEQWGGDLYPRVKEQLPLLAQKFKLFIVSNCLSGYIENFIRFHHLENIFSDFECSGNTGLPKSENIRLVIKRNGLMHPVYVGDTAWDHEAAKANGIPFIYVKWGFGKTEGAEKEIDDFRKLVQW